MVPWHILIARPVPLFITWQGNLRNRAGSLYIAAKVILALISTEQKMVWKGIILTLYFLSSSKYFSSCILGVSASADNCILTTYNFLANSSNDFHIVCEKFKDKVNSLDDKSTETVFVPNVSPMRAPTGVSLTNSTAFSLRSSSYEDTGLDSSSPDLSEEGSADQNLGKPSSFLFRYPGKRFSPRPSPIMKRIIFPDDTSCGFRFFRFPFNLHNVGNGLFLEEPTTNIRFQKWLPSIISPL